MLGNVITVVLEGVCVCVMDSHSLLSFLFVLRWGPSGQVNQGGGS